MVEINFCTRQCRSNFGLKNYKIRDYENVHDTQNIAPSGWHVSTDDEWKTLSNYLGGNDGGQLKEEGYAHWFSTNAGFFVGSNIRR